MTGLPKGFSAGFTPITLAVPGSGSSIVKLSASSVAKAGIYSVTLVATSGTIKQQMPLTITCTAHH